jgi:hypothetical protein
MRLARYVLFACLCLGLVPIDGSAATISIASSPGEVGFDGTLDAGNDVALVPFTIDSPSLFTVEFSAGFFPVLMLFGPVVTPSLPAFSHLGLTYQALLEIQTLDTNSISLTDPFPLAGASGTPYLLAITQSPNFYDPFSGFFEAANDPNFLSDFPDCAGFVDAAGLCGTGSFIGGIGLQTVPEPGTVSLLLLGAVASLVRRRWDARSPNPTG